MSIEEELCKTELLSMLVYRAVASREQDPHRRKVLEELAAQEERHYRFWAERVGGCSVPGWLVSLYAVAYRLLGPVFVLKLLERGEERVIRMYRGLLERGDSSVEWILRDEEEHEKLLEREVQDVRLKYVSYVALGLADAIVEITGVNAGFLGATSNPVLAGVAGLVVGFSAAISMAGAAYLQAKHGGGENPVISALVTGLSYIITVALLVMPFFTLTWSILLSFAASVAVAVALTLAFTFYTSVVEERSFGREATESLALLFSTAAASYAFGRLINVLGLREAIP